MIKIFLFTFAIAACFLNTSCTCQKKRKQIINQELEIDSELPEFKKAENSIVLVDPKTIKEIHPELLFILQREKCKIPKAVNDPNKVGWIQGHFASPKQLDMAVLCITPEKEMTVKIGWGGNIRPCSISIGYGMSKKYIKPTGTETFGFLRTLRLAQYARLKYFANYYKKTPAFNGQDGIEDTVLKHKSTIYMCANGKWQSLIINLSEN